MAAQDEQNAAERAMAKPGVWVTLYKERANANDVTTIRNGGSEHLKPEQFEVRSGLVSTAPRRYTVEVRYIGHMSDADHNAELRARITAALREEFEDALPQIVARTMRKVHL